MTYDRRCTSVFPLPFIGHASPAKPHSRHTQQRRHTHQYIINACNLLIQSLNAAHSPASFQPFHIPFVPNQSVYTTVYTNDYTNHPTHAHTHASLYANPTKPQHRVHGHIYRACKRMLRVSHRDTTPVPLRDDIVLHNTQCSNISTSVFTEARALERGDDFLKSVSQRSTPELDLRCNVKADALPIVADNVSLPTDLNVIPMLSLLHPSDAKPYVQPSDAVLRTPQQYSDLVSQLQSSGTMPRTAVVLGSTAEYTKLVSAMHQLGMLSFTTTPKSTVCLLCPNQKALSALSLTLNTPTCTSQTHRMCHCHPRHTCHACVYRPAQHCT